MMKTVVRTAVLALGFALALPHESVAQDQRLSRLPADARAMVVPVIDSAQSAGLPGEPLVNRALEGASKGAPPALIAAAVRRLAVDLGRSRDALGAEVGPADMAAGADALRAGAPPSALRRVRDALGTRRLTVPLGVIADLAVQGVPPDSAATVVITLARSVADAELLALQRDVERDIALGALPAAAVQGRALDLASPNNVGPTIPGATKTPSPRKP